VHGRILTHAPPPGNRVHDQGSGRLARRQKKFLDKDAGIVAEIERKVGVSVGS